MNKLFGKILNKKTKSDSVFNLKYNLLAIFNIIINAANSILIMKIFGISYQADVYTIITAMNVALTLIPALLYQQFMYFYNDAKTISIENAKEFYNVTFKITLIFSIIFVASLTLLNESLFYIFANNLDSARLNLGLKANLINLLCFLFIPLTSVNSTLLNAESKFSVPFILRSVPPVFTSVALISMLFTHNFDLLVVMYAILLGYIVSFAIQIFLLYKLKLFSFDLKLKHPLLFAFLKNSITMQLGNNINNLLIIPVKTNILVLFPEGYPALFGYAERFVSILQQILIGPSSTILQSKISRFWSEKNVIMIKDLTKQFLKNGLAFLIPSIIVLYVVLPSLFNILIKEEVSGEKLLVVQILTFLLGVNLLQRVFEMPYLLMLFSAKNSLFIIMNNTRNIIITCVTIFASYQLVGIYSIAFGLIAGMLHNNLMTFLQAKKELKKLVN